MEFKRTLFWLKKICYISYGLCNCSERYMEVFTQHHPHTVQIHMHSPLTFGLKLLIEQKMQTDLAISDAGAVTSLISYEHVIYDLWNAVFSRSPYAIAYSLYLQFAMLYDLNLDGAFSVHLQCIEPQKCCCRCTPQQQNLACRLI